MMMHSLHPLPPIPPPKKCSLKSGKSPLPDQHFIRTHETIMRSTDPPRILQNTSLFASIILVSSLTGCCSMSCYDPCTPCYDSCTPCGMVPQNPYCVEMAVPSIFHPMMPGYYSSCNSCCNTCASPPGRYYPKRPNIMTRETFRPDLCRPSHRRNRCVEDYCVEDHCLGNGGCVEIPSCVAPPDCCAPATCVPVSCALPGYQASVGYQGMPQTAAYYEDASMMNEPRKLNIDVPLPVTGKFPEEATVASMPAKMLVEETEQEMEFLAPIQSKSDAPPMLPIESGVKSQLKSPQKKPVISSSGETEGDSAHGPPLVPPAS